MNKILIAAASLMFCLSASASSGNTKITADDMTNAFAFCEKMHGQATNKTTEHCFRGVVDFFGLDHMTAGNAKYLKDSYEGGFTEAYADGVSAALAYSNLY